MYTSAELQMLRNADPGARLPGIETPTGNPLAAGSLTSYLSLTTNGHAPYFYDPIHNRICVTQNGAVLSGINFGSATLYIAANNVTVKNCTFAATTGYYSVQQISTVSGATIENCTFAGPTYSTQLNSFVGSQTPIVIQNNSFINTPSHAININAGVVTGNYFSGAGYQTGAHADAIWVGATTAPVSITNNFIDWTATPGAAVGTNNAIWLNPGNGTGVVSNVTVSGNYLLGGQNTISATGGPGFSNVSITNNYIGFGAEAFYPGTGLGVTEIGNVIFDWTNPIYATEAWTAYKAAGIPTPNLIVSTGGNIENTSSQPTTLYSGGFSGVHMYGGYGGSLSETNFVGGRGAQYMYGGEGANIYTELSVSNSGSNTGFEEIANFDPAKDIIDLSHIDANLTSAGIQSFSFVGTAALTGAGGQVSYQQDPTHNVTNVYVALAGDASPDMEIQLGGLLTLSAANFALTPAQSSADMTGGKSLGVSTIYPGAGAAREYVYTGVSGRPYSSYESIECGWDGVAETAADDLNLSSSANELDLYQGNLTIARGSGAETIADATSTGKSTFTLAYHANEVAQANSTGLEAFQFGANFGSETINGFVGSGTNADTIQLKMSSFSYLNPSMTQAQDLAAVLSHASSSGSATTILDSNGDRLTLAGFSVATLEAPTVASAFKFV